MAGNGLVTILKFRHFWSHSCFFSWSCLSSPSGSVAAVAAGAATSAAAVGAAIAAPVTVLLARTERLECHLGHVKVALAHVADRDRLQSPNTEFDRAKVRGSSDGELATRGDAGHSHGRGPGGVIARHRDRRALGPEGRRLETQEERDGASSGDDQREYGDIRHQELPGRGGDTGDRQLAAPLLDRISGSSLEVPDASMAKVTVRRRLTVRGAAPEPSHAPAPAQGLLGRC